VTFDYDRTATFSAYKRYAWTRGTELPDELNHARIVRMVEARLLEKGLARVEPGDSPDVLVAYHASFDQNLRIDGFSTGWGPLGLGPDRSGSATVQKVLVGTLVVDIIDARARTLVWRGLASGVSSRATSPSSGTRSSRRRPRRCSGITRQNRNAGQFVAA
jgi:hypothetical protein